MAWDAPVIIATTGLVTSVGGIIIGIIGALRANAAAVNATAAIARSESNGAALAVMDVKLDGQSEKLNSALAAAAQAKGKEEGIQAERRDPQVSAESQAAPAAPQNLSTPSLQIQADEVGVQKSKVVRDGKRHK